MPYLVTLADGKTQKFLRAMTIQEIESARAQGMSVSEVADDQWTTDAGGNVLVSVAAYQQAQAIATGFQFAAAQRALEANQISAYGQQTSRIGQMLPLVGQSQNYGLLANVTAGDPRAPYLAVPAGLARLAGPGPVQPDYASLKTYSASDVSDFAKKVQGQEQTSAEKQAAGSTKPTTSAATAEPQAADATGQGGQAQGLGWGPTQGTRGGALPRSAEAITSGLNAGGVRFRYGTGDQYMDVPSSSPWAQQYRDRQGAAGATGVAATATPAPAAAGQSFTPNFDRVSGEAGRHPGQSEWEARRDSWLGGQSHDAFQLAHSTTAQELNDVIKAKNRQAFDALRARGAWTPETSHGSNWRAAGDGGRNPQRDNAGKQVSFDYNGPAEQSYHQPHDRTLSETPEQRHKRQQKEAKARERATGGTDIMAPKPSLFGGGAPPMPDLGGGLPPALPAPLEGSEPMGTGGLPFDPHDPNQSPENLAEIADILAAPPSPSPSALEAAVRECWSLGQDGIPIYTHNFEEAASLGVEGLPDGGLPVPPDANDLALGQGGGLPPLPPSGAEGGGPPAPPSAAPGERPALFKRGGTTKLASGGTPQPKRDQYGGLVDYGPGSPGWVATPVQTRGQYVPHAGAVGQSGQPIVAAPAPAVQTSGQYVPHVGPAGQPGLPIAIPPKSTPAAGPAKTWAQPAAIKRVRDRAGGSGTSAPAAPAQPAGPSEAEWAKMTNYAAAQWGLSRPDARKRIEAEPDYLESVWGMARAGELDQYAKPQTVVSRSDNPPMPARPVDTSSTEWRRNYLNQQATAARALYQQQHPANERPRSPTNPNGVITDPQLTQRTTVAHGAGSVPGPVTPPNPAIGQTMVSFLKDAISNMTPEEATAYVRRMLQVTMGGQVSPLQSMPLSTQTAQRAAGGTDTLPPPVYDYGEGDVRGPYQGGPFATPGWLEDVVRPIGEWASDRSYDLGLARGGTVPTISQPTTFVAERPTLFNAGGQPFQVGEGDYRGRPGADELVSVTPSPNGATVVHVDPLQRSDTGIPAAVAATANLAVPGSPYRAKAGPPASPTGVGHMATGGTRNVGQDPLVAVPFSGYPSYGGPPIPGDPYVIPIPRIAGKTFGQRGGNALSSPDSIAAMLPMTPDEITRLPNVNRNATGGTTYMPMTNSQWARRRALGGTDYLGPQVAGGNPTLPETLTTVEGITLVRQADGSYLPEPAAPPSAAPAPMGEPPVGLASGGTGVVSPYGTVVRPGTTPSKTGQVTVPGANKKQVTVPWFRAQPFPTPEYALARDVANRTPAEMDQLGQLSQQRTGIPLSQWEALRLRGLKGLAGPAPVGGMRGF